MTVLANMIAKAATDRGESRNCKDESCLLKEVTKLKLGTVFKDRHVEQAREG